jgi:DNA repair exonuclease SbcCD nuclease subunit
MKLAIITDTHWGVRNDNIAFMDNSKKFLDDIFFPYLDQHNITTICHLGDLVDRRKYINYNTALRLRQDFLDPISERGISLHIIAGNHDTYFKNTNRINALDELVRDRYKFNVYDQIPKEIDFDGCIVLMLPWICDENREVCTNKIRTTNATIVMGHLELAGFEMYKGSMVSHGDDASIFDRFHSVISGHYHHRSSNGHIFYCGSHGEFTWSDWNDPKGFHVLDTETGELEFIRNPFTMFEKVWYNDAEDDPQSKDLSYLKGKIVKVIVTNKSNPYLFDKFIEHLEKIGCLEMQIVDDHLNMNLEADDDIVNEAESTIDIFKTYISNMEIQNVNKQKLENTITDLYNEALTIE